jgi:hypothetical protein
LLDEKQGQTKRHTNISYLLLTLPIKDNEDDPNWYCVEMVNDKIIKIEANALDFNTIPITTCALIPRLYNWTGNTPLEDKIAIQNMMIWLINTEVESTMKLTDRIVLYREGELDVAAVNNRHRTGGFVPYKGQEQDLSRLLFSPQFQDTARGNVDWLVREMRQEDQESSPVVNMQNKYNQGGMNNSTLGAAQMQAGIGEMLVSNQVKCLVKGLKQSFIHQLELLKQTATSEGVKIGEQKVVDKAALLPKLEVTIKTSNVYTYSQDAQDTQNQITQIINYKATKLPEFNAIKLKPQIERLIRAYVKREDVAEYIDDDVFKQIEQQAANPQPPQPPPPPPPSLSINLNELTPNERAQALQQRGIRADQVGLGAMPGQPPQAPPTPSQPPQTATVGGVR